MSKAYKKLAKRLSVLLITVSMIITSTASVIAEPLSETADNAAQALNASDTGAGQQVAVDPNSNTANDEMYLAKMTKAFENDILALYINKDTTSVNVTSIAVKDKRSGKIWFSNPPDPASDKKALGINKFKLSSQINVQNVNQNDQKKQYDNYQESIKKNQYEITSIPNGVRISYLIGSKARNKEDLPTKITDERLNAKFLSKLSEEDKNTITQKLYVYRDVDGYWEWKSTNKTAEEQKMIAYIDEVGYTPNDLLNDNVENGVPLTTSDKVYYTIPVEYTLDKDNLVVRVPLSEVEYPEKYPIYMLDLLEFFGAAHISQDGYAFVPDGSGSLIIFNDKKDASVSYQTRLYGEDKAVELREKRTYFETSRIPVFGMKQGNSAFVAIIEDGDALAAVNAYRAGGYNSYNTVYPSFFIVSKDATRLGDGSYDAKVFSFQENIYKGDIKIRYAFLNDDKADYSGMAEYYRNYLMEKYNLSKISAEKDMPFYAETMGALRKLKSFLGISYMGLEPLTKYSQAQEIATELKTEGINNIKLRYTGWFNDGLDQTVAKDLDLELILGGSKEFKSLVKYTNENGIDLYPDVAFQFSPEGKGLSVYRDVGKFIDQRSMVAHNFDNVSQFASGFNYVISPNNLSRIIDDFMGYYKKYNIQGLSLSDMGTEVISDFTKKEPVDRQSSFNIVEEQVKKLQEKLSNVMITNGNLNAMLGADILIQAPMENGGFNMTDTAIPFYQMVFHGLKEYAGQPMNLSSEYNKDTLKAIEYGAGIYYKWTYAPSSKMKDTSYDYVYSSNYKDWISKATETYKTVNEALKDLQDKFIVDYKILAQNVNETVYEDGTSVIVNYNNKPVDINGVQVDAESFKVVKGGR